ncbi:Phytoene dehydrogenase-related protein [Fontimonas thermophila]|uniref:Pyridine nucleotide-disulfide oxidoreductase domain-containing protein 2 n=1 Tax=Fontimonas thermophila TaxID=1076937 RepID=A0A1I2I7F5_9GAMM|nr:NAD(P)/FAD-dependent oxidoreductase [Fontimonas thermophila]SFF37563.1 Phytoene dehydrogenase-related protein [Fontimonas thermophila]
MRTDVYDCIVIGAGHNGLVCAAYLAAAGRKVLVLERRDIVGGAAVTEEIAPGYRASTAAYLVSLLLPEIERDLGLREHGYRVLTRHPSSFTPLPDGRYLLMGPDAELNRREIGKFSARDAVAYPRYEAWLTRIAEALEPALEDIPADLLPLPQTFRRRGFRERLANLRRALRFHRSLARLGEDLPSALELLTGAATPILDRWFESPALKATLATDAIIGAFAPPSAPGTGYVLLHHVMGTAGGARGVWGYVEGGMGALTTAMRKAAEARGVQIRTGAEVVQIETAGGHVSGVRLASGERIAGRIVVSNATPEVTFRRLLGAEVLPISFREAVARIDYASASMKINLALSELPDFRCCPGKDAVGPQHRGTIHISPTLDYIEAAYADARQGQPSRAPVIELTLPTSVDTTLAPPGHHIAQLFVQYAPYALRDGHWDEIGADYADLCIDVVTHYAPNFRAAILHRQVLTPVDLERRFALTGGNIFHGAMSLHQLFGFRPVPGWSDYRTPLAGLYLCGAGAHPGGGVSGAPGRNAARAILGG